MNLVLNPSETWRRQHKFVWIVAIKIFAINLPSQPFVGHHLGFHIFFTVAFLGVAHFFYNLAVVGLDLTLILHVISLFNDTWHTVIFPRNLTFAWWSTTHGISLYFLYSSEFGHLHEVPWTTMYACHYISQRFGIYMRFLWSRTHGVPIHFLYCLEIWHLHEISLVKMQSHFL